MMLAPIDVDALKRLRGDLGKQAEPLRDPEALREIVDELLAILISHEEWRRESEMDR